MEATFGVSYCNCWLPSLGVIDGDRGAVFCSKCDKVLGCVNETMLVPTQAKCAHDETHYEDIDYGYASYEKQDWVERMHTMAVCDDCEKVLYEVIDDGDY